MLSYKKLSYKNIQYKSLKNYNERQPSSIKKALQCQKAKESVIKIDGILLEHSLCIIDHIFLNKD